MKGSLCRLAETSFLWRDTAMRIRERFNPRAPCGARHWSCAPSGLAYNISTHAPLAGRDEPQKSYHTHQNGISTHAPLAGRDRPLVPEMQSIEHRISTHAPLAGRDGQPRKKLLRQLYFNPRAPCGARQRGRQDHHGQGGISTHAPLAGRDRSGRCVMGR